MVLGEDGRVWLIDFDISRRYSRGAPADTVISGTQDFAAPEQYGFSQTDCRSDIFSLGVLLYWLVTGRTKVGEASAGSLDRCIRRCTAFDPERRYRSVAAGGAGPAGLGTAAGRVGGGHPGGGPSFSAGQAPGSWPAGRRRLPSRSP